MNNTQHKLFELASRYQPKYKTVSTYTSKAGNTCRVTDGKKLVFDLNSEHFAKFELLMELADSPSRIEFFRTMIDTAWQETQNKELA